MLVCLRDSYISKWRVDITLVYFIPTTASISRSETMTRSAIAANRRPLNPPLFHLSTANSRRHWHTHPLRERTTKHGDNGHLAMTRISVFSIFLADPSNDFRCRYVPLRSSPLGQATGHLRLGSIPNVGRSRNTGTATKLVAAFAGYLAVFRSTWT